MLYTAEELPALKSSLIYPTADATSSPRLCVGLSVSENAPAIPPVDPRTTSPTCPVMLGDYPTSLVGLATSQRVDCRVTSLVLVVPLALMPQVCQVAEAEISSGVLTGYPSRPGTLTQSMARPQRFNQLPFVS